MRERRGDGLADEETFEGERGFFRHPRDPKDASNGKCYHTGLHVSAMRVARRYLISGRVQGVGFRFFAEDAGRREGLRGWVRNLADGRVEIAAEGELEALARFEIAVRQGPRGAHVDHVEVDSTDQLPGATGFNIR
jgi:acylphosphatase